MRGLTCLLLGGAFAAGVAATAPFNPATPVALLRWYAVVGVALAVVVHVAGHRLGRHAPHVLLTVTVLMIGAGVSLSASLGGAMVAGYAYFWVAMYAAHFLSRSQAVVYTGLIGTTFGLALWAGGFPSPTAWVVVTGSVLAASVLVGNLVLGLHSRASTDHLTGLLNRHGLRQTAERELAIAQRVDWPIAVAIADLDGFKTVNDTEGHATGDRLLRELAASWRAGLRASDVVAREGGDEFVFLFPSTTQEQAEAVLERLALDTPVCWTAGVAVWDPQESFEACLRRADAALYEAKGRRYAAPGAQEVPMPDAVRG